MSPRGGVGTKLRSIRRGHRWTLAEVAGRTGIPVSTLSRIETDQVSPTYDQLTRLSDGLRLDLAQLFSPRNRASAAVPVARRSINHHGAGQLIETTNQSLRYLSTDLLNKSFTPILADIKTRRVEDFGEFMSHPGEEFLFVVEGELELHTECYAPVRLKAGESIFFDSTVGHAYVAAGSGKCKALSVCTVPQHHSFEPANSVGPKRKVATKKKTKRRD
ncbi:helix-turn-helix domain-containing protein [Steroidobacter sp.]|uniref:helix-turn-helix domain-containing protein n=1 Tax=Steroidobacter sp. TaxID=1978227 RepID=UPI001A49C18A|nr:XRE family transcriptional regulator [Steroidobacter sp.]MBL8267693.1 helix-turn-helix transcriptional regulator [Steroidobacter sp.]